MGSLPDQTGAALYAWAFDWAGNWVGFAVWDLTLDREPPTTSMEVYAPYGGASFHDFHLFWYGDDAGSGVTTYDVQYATAPSGPWTDFVLDTEDTYLWLAGDNGVTFYFRSRARDNAGHQGNYPAPPQAEYTINVCPVTADAYENDDSYQSASTIDAGGTAQSHNFHVTENQDWVKFDADEGSQYVIQTENVGGYADTVLYLYDTDGSTLLAYNDDYEGLGWASFIEWSAPADGTYYIKVEHFDPHAAGCETVYTLSVGLGQSGESGNKVYLPVVLRNR